jgi:branched-chain amino acid transport system substrate-binding protein
MKVVRGTAAGSVETPSLKVFREEYKAAHGSYPTQAYMTNAYDAVMVIALAMEHGKGSTGEIVRDNIRKVTGEEGEKVYAGTKGYAKAVKLIKEGKRVRYIGTVGPLTFDKYGDVTGPMAIWTVKGGKVTNVRNMSVEEIDKIAAKIKG